ncbi:MAG TPA: class I SAM-dependent methyltransferase [bacterium]|nr:class I SAM-dependent methyltransferase [bacterium]
MNGNIHVTVAAERRDAGECTGFSPRVCPVSVAPWLDNPFRRWMTGTRRLAGKYLAPGMAVLDIGCGPAPMLADIARVIGPEGRIICADIQREMLERVARKARRLGLQDQVRLHLSHPEHVGLEAGIADAAIAYWMVHEAPDPHQLIIQVIDILKPGGRFIIIEPAMHVSKTDFNTMINALKSLKLTIESVSQGWLNRTLVIRTLEP